MIEEGNILTFGQNEFGHLGIGDRENRNIPHLVDLEVKNTFTFHAHQKEPSLRLPLRVGVHICWH